MWLNPDDQPFSVSGADNLRARRAPGPRRLPLSIKTSAVYRFTYEITSDQDDFFYKKTGSQLEARRLTIPIRGK